MNLIAQKKLLTVIGVIIVLFLIPFGWLFVVVLGFWWLVVLALAGFVGFLFLLFLMIIFLVSYSDFGLTKKDKEFLKEAYLEAEKCLESGDFKVGAVIVYKDEIIARGYNQIMAKGDYRHHAEALAINLALIKLGVETFDQLKGEVRLYTSYEPCAMCEGMIVLTKLPKTIIGQKKGFKRLLKENYTGYLWHRLRQRSQK